MKSEKIDIKKFKEKIENKRQEIKLESERLRKIAKEIHKWPNCGNPVSGNRLYCSQECAYAFFVKYIGIPCYVH